MKLQEIYGAWEKGDMWSGKHFSDTKNLPFTNWHQFGWRWTQRSVKPKTL